MAAFKSWATAALLLILIDSSLAVQPVREFAAVTPGAKLVRSERKPQQQEPHRKILGVYLEWANTSHHDSPPSEAMLTQFDSRVATDPTVAMLDIPTDELYAEAYCGGKAYIRTCGFKHGPGICLKMATAQGISNECWRGVCMCSGTNGCREPVCRGPNDSPPFQCTSKHTPCADGSCVTLPGGDGWECWHPCNMNHRPWEYGQENQILVEDIRASGACEQYLRNVHAKASTWFSQKAKKLDEEEFETSEEFPEPKSYPNDGNGKTRTEAIEEVEPDPGYNGQSTDGSSASHTVSTPGNGNETVVATAEQPIEYAEPAPNGGPPAVPDDVQQAADSATIAYSSGTQVGAPTLSSATPATPAPLPPADEMTLVNYGLDPRDKGTVVNSER